MDNESQKYTTESSQGKEPDPASTPGLRFTNYVARVLLLTCSEALPAFVARTLVGVVSDCVAKIISGESVPFMKEFVSDLEFCLTAPFITRQSNHLFV
jgi:hypothetical protein